MPQDINLTAWKNGALTPKQKAEIIADIACNGFGVNYNKPIGWHGCDKSYNDLHSIIAGNQSIFTGVGHFDWYLFPCHCETKKDLSFEENDIMFYQEFYKQLLKKHFPNKQSIVKFFHDVVHNYHSLEYNNGTPHIRFEKMIQHLANAYKANVFSTDELKSIIDENEIETFKKVFQNETNIHYKKSFEIILNVLGHDLEPDKPQDIDLNAWRTTMTPKQKAEIIADIAVNGFAKPGGPGKYNKPDGWPETNISFNSLAHSLYDNLTALSGDVGAYMYPCHNNCPDLSFEENDTEFYKEFDKQIYKKEISHATSPVLKYHSTKVARRIIGFYHGNYPNSQPYKKYYEKAVQYIANAYKAGIVDAKIVSRMFTDANKNGLPESHYLYHEQFGNIAKNNNDINYQHAFKIIMDCCVNAQMSYSNKRIQTCKSVNYTSPNGDDLPEKIEDLPNEFTFNFNVDDDGSAHGGNKHDKYTLKVHGNAIEFQPAEPLHEGQTKTIFGCRTTADGHEEFYANGITTIDDDPYGIKNFLEELKKQLYQKIKKDKNKPKINTNKPKLQKIPKYVFDKFLFDDKSKNKHKKKTDEGGQQNKQEDKKKDFADKLEELAKKKRRQEKEAKKKTEEKVDRYNAEIERLQQQQKEIEGSKPKRRDMTLGEKIIVGALIITIIFAIIAYLVIQGNIDKEYKRAMIQYDKDLLEIENKIHVVNTKFHQKIPQL